MAQGRLFGIKPLSSQRINRREVIRGVGKGLYSTPYKTSSQIANQPKKKFSAGFSVIRGTSSLLYSDAGVGDAMSEQV